jgi:hypothetical protein
MNSYVYFLMWFFDVDYADIPLIYAVFYETVKTIYVLQELICVHLR